VHTDIDGTGISYEVSGPDGGTPVVMLHGFPDSARLWRNQVPALVDAGFRVVTPDLRGYGGSDKPTEVEQYGIPFLAGDVLGLMDHLGMDKAHVVGHDWGAALAWAIASLVPDRVERLVALSVGHPLAFAGAGFAQREKSWYMLLFQFEGIAERWLSDNNWANLRDWIHHPDADAVIADLEKNGSLTPGLCYYRANVPPSVLVDPPMELPPVQAPAMGIWSTGDAALTEAQMKGSSQYVAGEWRYERLDGPGHWMQLEAPDKVNALLLDFLK
jgi:pimeloyl-ACP methyl ester carboxylesterase